MLPRTARVAAFLASYAGTSSDGRPAAGASATMCPASPESSPTPLVAATGSTPPGTLDQPASASGEPAGEGSPAHAATRESRVPSSDPAAPTNTPARTGSERRDTQTTRAISPPSTTTRAPKPTELDAPESRGQVCEPYALLAGRERAFLAVGGEAECAGGGVFAAAVARELEARFAVLAERERCRERLVLCGDEPFEHAGVPLRD